MGTEELRWQVEGMEMGLELVVSACQLLIFMDGEWMDDGLAVSYVDHLAGPAMRGEMTLPSRELDALRSPRGTRPTACTTMAQSKRQVSSQWQLHSAPFTRLRSVPCRDEDVHIQDILSRKDRIARGRILNFSMR
jgi:hypothetical protein